MDDWLKFAIDWWKSHESLLYGLGAASIGLLVATALLVPRLVAALPSDEFRVQRRPRQRWRNHGATVGTVLRIIRNLVGALCVLIGIAMLVLPGQGLLTIFVGVLFLEFPGKRRVVLAAVSKSPVQRALNWMRRRRGVPEFVFDQEFDQPLSRKDRRALDDAKSAATTISPESPTKKKTSS